MFEVYIIKSTNKIYIGYSSNLITRLKRHNKILPSKKTSYTYKAGKKWQLIYAENYLTKQEALNREKYLKNYRGRQWIKKYLF